VETAGKIMLGAAIVLAVLGAIVFGLGKLGVDRLPGDILVRRGNFTFYAPLGLMIVLSIVLTILLNLFFRR
jgi:hypothetical protein